MWSLVGLRAKKRLALTAKAMIRSRLAGQSTQLWHLTAVTSCPGVSCDFLPVTAVRNGVLGSSKVDDLFRRTPINR
jgi:hypothetical protein